MPTDSSNFTMPDQGAQPAVWNPATGRWEGGPAPVGAGGYSNAHTDRIGNNPSSGGAPPTDGKVSGFANGTIGATWGGYGGTMVNGVYHPEMNGANADMERLSGLGAAAANREAYKTDYGQANADAAMGQTDRVQQGIAAGLARNTALNGDAQSQMLGRNMLQQGLQSQQAAAMSARGGSLAQAAAMRQVQNGQGAFMQQGNNALAAQRADDMAAGRSQYMNDMTNMRAQDAEAERLHTSQAVNQAKNEIDQRDLNQQGSMGYEAMGQNVSKAAGSALLGGAEIDAGIDAAAAARSVASAAKAQQTTGAAVGAAGTFVAGLGGAIPPSKQPAPAGTPPPYSENPDVTGSDERMKRNVRGLAAAAAARGGY